MSFIDEVIVKPLPDGICWELQHEVRYALPDGRVVYIPAGFNTDFASVPWFFRRIFQPATGKHRRGALVHDYIYRTVTEHYTKEEADQIFLDIMLEDGYSSWRAHTMYRAVKIGGSSSFKDRVY